MYGAITKVDACTQSLTLNVLLDNITAVPYYKHFYLVLFVQALNVKNQIKKRVRFLIVFV